VPGQRFRRHAARIAGHGAADGRLWPPRALARVSLAGVLRSGGAGLSRRKSDAITQHCASQIFMGVVGDPSLQIRMGNVRDTPNRSRGSETEVRRATGRLPASTA